MREINANNRIDVWAFSLSPSDCHSYNCLSIDERARAASFHRLEDARRFAAGRAGVRKILSSHLQVPNSEIVFDYSQYGKPSVCGAHNLSCSWSNSRDLCVIAVTRAGILGVDIEFEEPALDWREPASVAFHPLEIDFIEESPKGWLNRFYNVWTSKEAILKGVGTGLHDRMSTFSIISAGQDRSYPVIGPGNTCWKLFPLPIGTGFTGSLAATNPVAHVVYHEPGTLLSAIGGSND